ncbi:sigma factor-like helix-turn-helix DNA-binding protein [Paenibacillus sp. NRS-1760]|uniref:sigma factor-like helix-turn-helix DNA-binding protein n=1 Tax=Paenibacillus sp. NRS-1760 TaxID=3233902 RepID=UPI003D2B7703
MGESKDRLSKVDDRGFLIDLQDLKKSYRATLRMLTARRQEIEEYIERDTGMTLVQLGEKKNRNTYKQWRSINDSYWNELHELREMISDVNFTIEWLHTGRQPGNKRGIERRSVYQNTMLLDPMILANYANPSNSRSGSSLTEDEKTALREVLEILSPQERECYVMAHGHCIPQQQIARMLKLSEGSVATYIKRAHEKVSRGWEGTLF